MSVKEQGISSPPVVSSAAKPAMSLALTFLAIGLTFALPVHLVPESARLAVSDEYSVEVANVYACVAWAGWAHFLFAFRGQGRALLRLRDGVEIRRLLAFAAALAVTVAVLFLLRKTWGIVLFSGLVWVYFIDHFIKSEQIFEGRAVPKEPIWRRWLQAYQPLMAFGWLSCVLLNIANVNAYPWLNWTVSLLLGGIILAFGGWQKLSLGTSRQTLIALFFVAESLVWGAFSRYSGPMFLTGVYVFHIAAGSYLHYFGSYFAAHTHSRGKDRALGLLSVVAVNLGVILVGVAVSFLPWLGVLEPVLGIQWFTVWVATHLIASDLFPLFKGLQWSRQG